MHMSIIQMKNGPSAKQRLKPALQGYAMENLKMIASIQNTKKNDFGIYYKGCVLLKAHRQTEGEIRLGVFQIQENCNFCCSYISTKKTILLCSEENIWEDFFI